MVRVEQEVHVPYKWVCLHNLRFTKIHKNNYMLKKLKTLCSTVNEDVFSKFPTHKYIVKHKSQNY